MIKRGMLFLLAFFILAFSVNAMTVELVAPSPSGIEFQDVNSKDVICKVTKNDTEELTSLTVYYGNNESTAWQAGSTQNNPTSATEYTFSLTSLVNATYTWNCLAVNNETNEQFADSNRTFIITFTTAAPPAENHAPELLSNIPDMVWPEDTINNSLSLNTYFNDSDGQTMTFSVAETPSTVSVSIASNSSVIFTPNENWTGNTSIMFSASDGTNTTHSNPVSLTLTAVNDAPYLSSAILNKTWNKDNTAKIDLGEYFFDVDDSSLNYSYTFTSSSPFSISVNIESDGDAVFTPESGWTGSEILTFTAYDNANLSATSNEVILTVEASNATSNNPPSIDTYSPLSNPTISVGESQTFSITKSDPDGDTMNVTWYVDNVIQEGKTGDSFTYTASNVGSFTVKVAVSDGALSDLNTWVLTVKSAGITTNKTAQPGEEEVGNKTLACGDGVCAEGEDQFSCCKDCGCPEGYDCYEPTGKCRKETKAQNTILLIIVASVFLGGAGVGLYIYKKKQNEEIFGNLANIPFKLPPKEGGVEVKEEVKFQKPAGAVVKKGEEKPKTAAVEKPLKKAKSSSQVLLKDYVIQNLKKGKTWEQLKVELRSVGWTDEQIDEAYTAAQLDEAFS